MRDYIKLVILEESKAFINLKRYWNLGSNGRYQNIYLCKNKNKKCFYIHRLVAEAFIPNPNNLPEVNHKDRNKNNNYVENLEWVTASENMQHLRKCDDYNDIMKKSKDTRYNNLVKPKEKEIIQLYTVEKMSLKNISLKVGLYDTTIANCLKRNGINIRNAHQMKYYFLQFDTNWNLLMKHTNYDTIYDYVLNNTSCHSSHKSISRRIRLVSDTQEKAYGCYWKKILVEEEK